MSHGSVSPEPGSTASPAPAAPAPTGAAKSSAYVVITGNPNCGKTTIFNALTGLRAKVGNYAGVTVERKEGRLQGAPAGRPIQVLDLPGSYSLSPQSLDEQVARDILLQRVPEVPPPALVVIVVDAFNLQRNLYYATQVIELGCPTLLALNMVDVAESNGHHIDVEKLAEALGVPVQPLVASAGTGIAELRRKIVALVESPTAPAPASLCELPPPFRQEADRLSGLLAESFHERRAQAAAEAVLILGNERALASSGEHYSQQIQDAVAQARQRLEAAGVDWRGAPIEGRYARAAAIQQAVTTENAPPGETTSDRLDRILTHRIWGTLILMGVLLMMFQSIFTFARLPMNALQAGVDWIGGALGNVIPRGDLNSLLVDGVVAGVGAVIVFLPQILLLFLFIGFLEDTGYMARAAFLMDRLMSKVGLHGKSFIPMLSSFACAIPGIMASRTIESPKDRLVTILVSPLMSCSARLPVYTLLIAACIPPRRVLGVLHLQGLTMLGMYLLGIGVALFMAWLFKKTLLKGEPPMLIMELPPYKRPLLRQVLRHMWDRSKLFIRRAGTVILGINILLWFLATYPHSPAAEKEFAARRITSVQKYFPAVQNPAEAVALIHDNAGQFAGYSSAPNQHWEDPTAGPSPKYRLWLELATIDREEAGARVRNSFAGRMGRLIEPAIAPLGFDWQIGIGLITSFAAREVFVSTMSTVYNVGEDTGSQTGLVQTLREQKRADGRPMYTALTGLTLMVFYVFALQCVSTVAVVRRETNSWRWPLFQWAYMGVLAWGFAFATLHLGRLLGFE